MISVSFIVTLIRSYLDQCKEKSAIHICEQVWPKSNDTAMQFERKVDIFSYK